MLNYNFYISSTAASDSFTNTSDHVLFGGADYQVYPGVNRDIAKAWTKDDIYRWRETINGELWFTNRNAGGSLRSDYTILSQISSPSAEIKIRIEQIVGATTTSDWWEGYFSITDGKWDTDRGVVIITPAPDDNYRYLYALGDKQYNMIGVSGGLTAVLQPVTSTTELCSGCEACPSLDYPACEATFRADNTSFPADFGDTGDVWDRYAYCGPEDYEDCNGGGGICSGTDVSHKWQKQTSNFRIDSNWYWDEVNEEFYSASCSPVTTIDLNDRGMNLTDMIESLLSSIFTGTGVSTPTYKSNFFRNTDGGTANPITGVDPNPLSQIIFYQKSDIKTTSDPATQANISFNELMNMLSNIWNVYWFVDSSGDLRIEHWDYFSSITSDTDLTTLDSGRWINAKYKYEYDLADMPSREHFEWMEANGEDFVGLDIIYDKLATGNKFADTQKDRTVSATTDIGWAYGNPSDVSNEGWVILQTSTSDYLVGNATGAISGDTICNGQFSWANLHDDYWKYGRVISVGYMNGVETSFSDVQKNIKQIEITYPVGSATFDPNRLKTTQMGVGEVGEAEYRLLDGTVRTVFFYLDVNEPDPPPTESYLIKTSDMWYVLANNIDKIKWYG